VLCLHLIESGNFFLIVLCDPEMLELCGSDVVSSQQMF
jgi:hypothetical protein